MRETIDEILCLPPHRINAFELQRERLLSWSYRIDLISPGKSGDPRAFVVPRVEGKQRQLRLPMLSRRMGAGPIRKGDIGRVIIHSIPRLIIIVKRIMGQIPELIPVAIHQRIGKLPEVPNFSRLTGNHLYPLVFIIHRYAGVELEIGAMPDNGTTLAAVDCLIFYRSDPF